MWKWVRRISLGLGVLLLIAVAAVYVASEVIIRRTVRNAVPPIFASTDPAAVTRGAYQARIRGCDGCHTRNLQGEKWLDQAIQGRVWTSNLTQSVRHYSDPELARAIRAGVRADGTALWMMPSESWTTLSDQDTADIIAWLRSHPAAGEPTPRPRFGPLLRLAVVIGKLRPATAMVEDARSAPAIDVGPAFGRGRYLAVTSCAECHGSSLKGAQANGQQTPDLVIASTYSRPEFAKFMRTGVAPDGGKRGWMSEIASEHFGQATDRDLADIHAYLVERAKRTTPE